MRRELDDGFELDDDVTRIDVDAVHAYISGESYWGRGRPRELVERSIAGSLRVVGLYRADEQVGDAVVVPIDDRGAGVAGPLPALGLPRGSAGLPADGTWPPGLRAAWRRGATGPRRIGLGVVLYTLPRP